MGKTGKAAFISAILAALMGGQPVLALDASSTATDGAISNCFGAPASADKAIVRNVCLTAFDGAIKEAQRSDVHSANQRRLYWAQASQAAGILVVLFVEEENGFGTKACRTAYRGWQSWYQIDPQPAADDPSFRLSSALQSAVTPCQERWDRGEAQ